MSFFENIRAFVTKYERHLSAGALAGGFIIDTLTFQRIDVLVSHVVLFVYLGIAAFSILFLNARAAGRWQNRFSDKTAPFFPVFTQYAFGGLFSAFAIFYTKSASLATSWPFLLFIFALLIGNETFRARYQRFGFQITLFFIVLFSFLIFYIPVIVGKMGASIFLLSGALSLLGAWFFVRLVLRVAPIEKGRAKRIAIFGIGTAFVFINYMYFANIIPPIPLALEDGGVYHRVYRAGDGYHLVDEERSFLARFRPTQSVSITPGEPLYFYSAVFAPTKLETVIAHRWQYYDETTKEWVTSSEIAFPISGGREGGYRGYTIKEAPFQGLWRVQVVTERGQVVGGEKFNVAYSAGVVTKESIKN